MIDGDAASLVQSVQSQTGGIGVACQCRQLSPTTVFPLLAREVKPWPGLVNVEGLPGEDDAAEGDAAEAEET